MKLKRRYGLRPDAQFSIADAVDLELSSDYSGGQIEELRFRLYKTSKFVGQLVELLHDNEALDDLDMTELLPSFELVK